MNKAEALPYFLSELKAFQDVHGHTNVPRTSEDHPALGAWVSQTRETWRQGKLHPVHIEKLEAAGFCFAPLDVAWQKQYDALVAYVKENGDAKVPRDFADHSLAVWVMHQRAARKQGTLPEKEFALLCAVKFIFEPHDHQWADNLARLAKFKSEHGHTMVPRRHAPDVKLGDFCCEIRQRFKANTLSEKQVADLVAAQFVFDPIDAVWSANLSDYAAWRASSGDSDFPPRREGAKLVPLYQWCRLQLQNIRDGKMLPARIQRLAEVGFPIPP